MDGREVQEGMKRYLIEEQHRDAFNRKKLPVWRVVVGTYDRELSLLFLYRCRELWPETKWRLSVLDINI